eukprot:9940527-Alexandrium_andersonii.AAC.1
MGAAKGGTVVEAGPGGGRRPAGRIVEVLSMRPYTRRPLWRPPWALPRQGPWICGSLRHFVVGALGWVGP